MRYVFVTGMGRSGTTFLSHLLHGIPGVEAHHEYVGDKWFPVLGRYVCSESYAVPYLQRCKAALDDSLSADKTFVDVNSYLRYSVPALKQVFDGCVVYHLVRDPQRVVPSLYVRRGESIAHSMPVEDDDIRWLLDADKFEQVCWTWADTTRRLLNQDTRLLQFERLISDYDYLDERLLGPLNLSLSKADWLAKKDTRVNKTRSKLFRYLYAKLKNKNFVEDSLPPYPEWSDAQKQRFEQICGQMRHRVGYD